MARPTQFELRPRTWGGRRPGAGRKPSGRRVGVPHRPRPDHVPRHPAHVTLRARAGLPSLRGGQLFATVRRCLAQGSRGGFRILHFSVQTTFTCSSRPTGERRFREGYGDSSSGSPRESIEPSGDGEESGEIGITRVRSRHPARCETRSSTFFRTGGGIAWAAEPSIPAPLPPGSMGGRKPCRQRSGRDPSSLPGRGSPRSAGGGWGWFMSKRRRHAWWS